MAGSLMASIAAYGYWGFAAGLLAGVLAATVLGVPLRLLSNRSIHRW
jgi:tetrahydromethanopterin S-methyltransferase subunit F